MLEDAEELLELGFDELALEEELLDGLEDELLDAEEELELLGLLEDAEELELLGLLDEAALDAGCEELADEELLDELELAGELLDAELDTVLEELDGALDELTASLELAGALDALLELDGVLLEELAAALLATLEDAGAPLTPQPVRIIADMTADAATTEAPRKRYCFNLIMISPLKHKVSYALLCYPPPDRVCQGFLEFSAF